MRASEPGSGAGMFSLDRTFRAPARPRRRGPAAGLLALALAPAWGAALQGAPHATEEWPRTDFTKTLVPLDEITPGGPPKDGIPAINHPRFVSTGEAGRWLDPREPVIAFVHAGDARAYPLEILIWHEIANDTVGGLRVAVTFCPLCNAAIVFDRRVGQKVVDFGTTGKLRKSDLVMYDRQTESWWQQFTGEAIVGALAGSELHELPASIVSFADFARTYRQGKVLSRATGYDRPYGHNPYRGYDRVGSQPFLFHDRVDPRLPAMERVISVTINGRHRLYPFAALRQEPVVNDMLGGVPVVVFSRSGTLSILDRGEIRKSRTVPSATAYERRVCGRTLSFELRAGGIVDRETGSHWDLFGHAVAGLLKGTRLPAVRSGVDFAFAWLAFNPDSSIYHAAPR